MTTFANPAAPPPARDGPAPYRSPRPAEVCDARCVQEAAVSREGVSEPRPRPASIRDVARLAGVSHQTVSRVLNGHGSIRDGSKSRVLAAMDELQFRPSRAAR